jgi:serine protease inhibitor
MTSVRISYVFQIFPPGTTAFSATEIELVNKFGGEPREFIVDRPFLFYIEDDTTGAKLFSGRVNNPEY